MRIDKYLAHALNITRKGARKIIKDSLVTVNDTIINNHGHLIDIETDTVYYNGEVVFYESFTYLMMNKPAGVISARKDRLYETVVDLIDEHPNKSKLFPIGRLDLDTEGLIILTNDGKLSHYLTSPNNKIIKRYFVRMDQPLSKANKEKLLAGVVIKDGRNEDYLAKAEKITSTDYDDEILLDLTEGKFHQVKRMLRSVGLEVRYLKRIMMNNLFLDENLIIGDYRSLTDEELSILRNGK